MQVENRKKLTARAAQTPSAADLSRRLLALGERSSSNSNQAVVKEPYDDDEAEENLGLHPVPKRTLKKAHQGPQSRRLRTWRAQ